MTKAERHEVANIIREQLDPVTKEMHCMSKNHEKVWQTIFGPEGNNGIYADVAQLKKQVEDLEISKAKAIGFATAIGAIAGTVGSFVGKLIKL